MDVAKMHVRRLAEDVDRLLISLQGQMDVRMVELEYSYLTQISALMRECDILRRTNAKKSTDGAIPFLSLRRRGVSKLEE